MSSNTPGTTVAVSNTTKARLDKWRAQDQCYDDFLRQLVGLWERTHNVNSNNKHALGKPEK